MGPMLLLVLGILSAVGLGLYQFSELHRFDMAPDSKGGIFIIDRKTAAINYCDDKTCTLVGNGALPSKIMGNPSALASMQGAIMGSPAAAAMPNSGQAPTGMQTNIAASGGDHPAQADTAAQPQADPTDDSATHDDGSTPPAADAQHDDPAANADPAPDGFSFN